MEHNHYHHPLMYVHVPSRVDCCRFGSPHYTLAPFVRYRLVYSLQDIPILPELKVKLGRCEVFSGTAFHRSTGQPLDELSPADLTLDRLFVRDRLRGLMADRRWRFIIDRVDVYAPSAILHGISLVDGPGMPLMQGVFGVYERRAHSCYRVFGQSCKLGVQAAMMSMHTTKTP